MIDNRTPSLNYPLPNVANNLRDDVTRIIASLMALDADMSARALKESPTFTGAPKAPTPAANDKSTRIPTTSWVVDAIASAVSSLVAGAPGALDTLHELADALGDDPNFSATVATALSNRLRHDADAALTPAQRAQGKKNLRVEQPSFTFATNQTLTAAHVGAAIGCDPGCTALTLPLLSTVESGAKLLVHAYTQSVTVTVDAAETLGFFAKGTANVKSIVVPAQWSLEAVSRGPVWLPRLVPYGYDVPNANVALTFSAAQKRILKQQIGAGGAVGGISATSTLLASSINSLQYVLADGYTVTLPRVSNWVIGDYIEFANVQNGTVTVARDGNDTASIYFNGTNLSNIPIGPGQTLKLTFDGVNFISSGRALSPERSLGVDGPASFTLTQIQRGRQNLRLDGSGVLGINASTALLASNSGQLHVVNSVATAINIDLPPVANTANGDVMKIINQTTVDHNIRVDQGADQAGSPVIVRWNNANAKSITLRGGVTLEIRSNGGNWYVESSKPSFETVQQGGAAGQGPNKIFLGWTANGYPTMQVDQTALGRVWTDFSAAFSLNATGYWKAPNGLIMQWSRVNMSAAYDAFISFPLLFPNTVMSVQTSFETGDTAANVLYAVKTDSVQPAGFNGRVRYAQGGGTVGGSGSGLLHYLAVGY